MSMMQADIDHAGRFLAGVLVFMIGARAKYLGAIFPIVAGMALLVYTHASGFFFTSRYPWG